jgi:putative hydrolase of the HAD superfamily
MKNEITTLFIDLDGTVYDKHNGLLDIMTSRIHHYMQTVVGIPEEEVIPTGEYYYNRFGSSLQGLQIFYDIDSGHYLEYIHDIPLQDHIQPDPALRQALLSLPQRKWIFTNSDRNHAGHVLSLLGIEDMFEGILDVWAMDYVPKPQRWVYKKALKYAGSPAPQNCLFVDDTLKNLKTAADMGWHTIWMDDSRGKSQNGHLALPKLHYLPQVLSTQQEPLPAFQLDWVSLPS